MILAGRRANALGIPVVLDPVAVGVPPCAGGRAPACWTRCACRSSGATPRRSAPWPWAGAAGSGVDVAAGDVVSETSLAGAAALAENLARRTGAVTVVSGPMDIVTDGTRTVALRNGSPTMARITGSGCMLTALIGAFCGAHASGAFPGCLCRDGGHGRVR